MTKHSHQDYNEYDSFSHCCSYYVPLRSGVFVISFVLFFVFVYIHTASIAICYAQTADPDDPWIVLCKPWIHTLSHVQPNVFVVRDPTSKLFGFRLSYEY